MLRVTATIAIPESELLTVYSRASGPGGQNVQKTSSRAQLRFHVVTSPSLPKDVRDRFIERYQSRLTREGEIILSSQKTRDAKQNAADCRQRLLSMIQAVATPPKTRRRTRPPRTSVEKRLIAKKSRSEIKRQRKTKPIDE